MTKKVQPLDKALVKALADAARTDESTIVKLHELQEMRDREKLKELIPTIKRTFEGFGENGYEDSALDLSIIAQRQMGVKLVEALNKARKTSRCFDTRSQTWYRLQGRPSSNLPWISKFQLIREHL